MCMRNRIEDRFIAALVVGLLVLGLNSEIRADRPPPTNALGAPAPRPFPAREGTKAQPPSTTEGGSGWWIGTAGIALALAAIGWLSFASKRYLPKTAAGSVSLRVVGRTSLSPKQSVYLLQVGERVLIVGAGGQGAPSLLGELQDADTLARLVPPSRTETRLGADA